MDEKGSVAVSDKGYLFILLGKYLNKDTKEEGVFGVGFNGLAIKTPIYTILAKNLNEFLIHDNYEFCKIVLNKKD